MGTKPMKISKTVSLDYDLLSEVLDVSYAYGKDFSWTIQLLLRYGLIRRKEELEKAQKAQAEAFKEIDKSLSDEEKKIVGRYK